MNQSNNINSVEKLITVEEFNNNVWNCYNGLGEISDVLSGNGYNVKKSDVTKVSDDVEVIDIVNYNVPFNGDIVAQPLCGMNTADIIEKLIQLSNKKVALYYNVSYLAVYSKKEIFEEYKPKVIYLFKKIDTDLNKYCWIVWDKDYNGDTLIKWI